jgi:hypothetical protein
MQYPAITIHAATSKLVQSNVLALNAWDMIINCRSRSRCKAASQDRIMSRTCNLLLIQQCASWAKQLILEPAVNNVEV